jgi:hypothetical protein
MAGYTDTYTYTSGIIRTTHFETEYNKLGAAFSSTSGHRHDGSSDEGAYVPLISNTNGGNKVAVASASVDTYIGGVKQFAVTDGAIAPTTHNDVDLGSSSYNFKNGWFAGSLIVNDLVVSGTASIPGTTIPTGDIGAGALPTDVTVNDGNWAGVDLAISNGGTGASTAGAAASNLGLGTEDSPTFSGINLPNNSLQTSWIGAGALPTDVTVNGYNWSGSDLSIANGGTGASTAAGAASALGLGTEDSPTFTGLTTNNKTILALSGGNVGIGTGAPGYHLHLSGAAAYSTIDATSGNAHFLMKTTGSDWLIYATDSVARLNVRADGNTRFIFKKPGQVRYMPLSGPPSADVEEGDLYYDSSTHKFRGRTNTGWVDLH